MTQHRQIRTCEIEFCPAKELELNLPHSAAWNSEIDNEFDQAIGEFALTYADQNEKDHAALVAAVKAGMIQALVEDE